jgi:urea transport system permease protein
MLSSSAFSLLGRAILSSGSHLRLLLGIGLGLLTAQAPALQAASPREVIARALVNDDAEEQSKLVSSLAGTADPLARDLLTAWKEGGIHIFEAPADLPGFAEGQKVAVTLIGEKDAEDRQVAIRVDSTETLKDGAGQPIRLSTSDVELADTSSDLRVAMKGVLDLFALAAPEPQARLNAVSTIGLAQDPAQLGALRARQQVERDSRVQRAIHEAIALVELKSEDPAAQAAAAKTLGEMGSISSQDALKQLQRDSIETAPEVARAAANALAAIETHTKWVNFYGTLFRGLSLGSVLLVVAIGLAITFGLMGVINMAHGELIVVGAYTTYVVQNIFGAGLALSPFGLKLTIPGLNTDGALYSSYFLLALPLAFLSAALVGIALERSVIRFLYRRPLESLLATWGVSLVLQQLFRLIFGANNVQVYSPAWLSGNWTVFDVILGWNRVFVIAFAAVIVAGTWALLTKTSLGLLIRAVMQNRQMAACMGVRTERVNMLTFGFGSGLAGLAGAFLSQIGNVGPGLGQNYIVDAFMTVVVGGVGNIFGTVVSAVGIGMVDQSLQQILLNPVLGKILVLAAIILFLQWRPAGLFVTKSRSLES